MSVATLQCSVESDRAILLAKVHEEFVSEASFVRFVRATGVALIVRDLLLGIAKYDGETFLTWVGPWLSFCRLHGLQALADMIESCDAVTLWQEAGHKDGPYLEKLAPFLNSRLYPFLEQERRSALRSPEA
mmetsp:Transcript_63532/g.150522  ORF Transcript_63532/g.150522 Transcript_63532/m.150522 type:complete len:131 (-) Transcript_63532:78-470(-)